MGEVIDEIVGEGRALACVRVFFVSSVAPRLCFLQGAHSMGMLQRAG